MFHFNAHLEYCWGVIQILFKYYRYSIQQDKQERSVYKVDHNFLTYTVIMLTNAINIVPDQIFSNVV
jgi:hypothetical protein